MRRLAGGWLIIGLGALLAGCDADEQQRRGGDGGGTDAPGGDASMLDGGAGDAAAGDAAIADAGSVDAATMTDAAMPDDPPATATFHLGSGGIDEPPYPAAVVAPDGSAIAAWTAHDLVHARRFVPGTGWGPVETIDSSAGAYKQVVLAVAPDGAVTAAWRAGAGTGSLWSNRHVPGAGWGTAVRLDSAADGNIVSSPAMAASSAGEVLMVWSQGFEDQLATTRARRYTPGAGWGPPVVLHAGGVAGPTYVDVEVDDQGNGLAVWTEDIEPGGREVWAAYHTAAGWGAATRVDPATGFAFNPRIGFEPSGTAVVAWVAGNATQHSIESARFSPGSGWTSVTALDTADSGFRDVDVTTGHAPIAVVWWRDSTIRWSRALPGGWSPAEVIGNGVHAQVAARPGGELLLAYANAGDVHARRHLPGAGWTEPHRIDDIDDVDDEGYAPRRLALAVAGTGHELVVWQEGATHSGSSMHAYADVP